MCWLQLPRQTRQDTLYAAVIKVEMKNSRAVARSDTRMRACTRSLGEGPCSDSNGTELSAQTAFEQVGQLSEPLVPPHRRLTLTHLALAQTQPGLDAHTKSRPFTCGFAPVSLDSLHACARCCMHVHAGVVACMRASLHACARTCMHADVGACMWASLHVCVYAQRVGLNFLELKLFWGVALGEGG